ncbi:MAG: 16S rRNA (guanine(527)-N(7))-methyltransferase RsmG [Thermodesulfobacteriota bacterium]|jgi:16S rRNA (guanine527-N7)-methyltransferase
MENETSNLLKDGAARIGISLTQDQMKAFNLYLKELNAWKRNMNLIRRENERDIILKDFIDSMTIVKHLPLGASLVDLGSGAGFPGIPVKIVRADIKVFLLESVQKKVFFLKNVIRVLGLTGIEVRREKRSNGQQKDSWGEFDFVVSRAFGSLERLSSIGGSLLKKGGILLAMKGKKGKEELAESLPFLEDKGWKQAFIDQMRLPFLNHDRTLIGLQKK